MGEDALNEAAEQISSTYRQATVDKVNDISEIYDQLSIVMPSLPVDRAVQEAIRCEAEKK